MLKGKLVISIAFLASSLSAASASESKGLLHPSSGSTSSYSSLSPSTSIPSAPIDMSMDISMDVNKAIMSGILRGAQQNLHQGIWFLDATAAGTIDELNKKPTTTLIRLAQEASARGDETTANLIITAFATQAIQNKLNHEALSNLSVLPSELYIATLRLIIARRSYFQYIDSSTLSAPQALLLIKLHTITCHGRDTMQLSPHDLVILSSMSDKNQRLIRAYINEYNSTLCASYLCCYNCGQSIKPFHSGNGPCCSMDPDRAEDPHDSSHDSSCVVM